MKNDAKDFRNNHIDSDGTFLTADGDSEIQKAIDHKQHEMSSTTLMHDIGTALGSFGRSTDDDNQIILKFHNAHNAFELRVIWVDYDGEMVVRRHLKPGESYMEKSFGTHPW
eukprot:2328633-Ditylum_brightwellii.AAC.1